MEISVASFAKSTGFWRLRAWPKTHVACHRFDDTYGIVATTFAAPVDVTGAVKDNVTVRSGRSHRSSLADHVAGFRVLNRTVNRS